MPSTRWPTRWSISVSFFPRRSRTQSFVAQPEARTSSAAITTPIRITRRIVSSFPEFDTQWTLLGAQQLDRHPAILRSLLLRAAVRDLAQTVGPDPRRPPSLLHEIAPHRLDPLLTELQVVVARARGICVPLQVHGELGVLAQLLDQRQ